MIRTKIVATLGPASSAVDVLVRLLEEGVDVFRLNFSHGDLAEHARVLANVREAAARFGQPIAVLGDLCGPKIRLGKVADQAGTGGMPIDVGDTLRIVRGDIVGENGRVGTTYERFVDDVAVGDRVLVEDGLLRFVVTEKHADEIVLATTAGGVLKSAKGINLPNTRVSIPSITEKDWQSIDWAIANDLDYLALSFVRHEQELVRLREYLDQKGSGIRTIAKIEKPEALEHIDAIVAAADGLMVARGDLGVEMDVALVPIIQKDLVRRCQAAGKPVIVATQMLQSMIEQSSPTRAEVSDVANAIFDGADAVMLSGETSVGKFPIGAVHVMNHVAEVTEEYLLSVRREPPPAVRGAHCELSSAVAHGVWDIVRDLAAKAVVVWSQTGTTARIFSSYRFPVPILAPSDQPCALRQMALHYGVAPVRMDAPASMRTLIAAAEALVRMMKLAQDGERIIVVGGSTMGAALTISGIVIHTIGQTAAPGSAGVIELEKK